MCLNRPPVPHPIVAELALRRITRRSIADQLGYTQDWIERVVMGAARPSPELARRMAGLLDLPVESCFRLEVLS